MRVSFAYIVRTFFSLRFQCRLRVNSQKAILNDSVLQAHIRIPNINSYRLSRTLYSEGHIFEMGYEKNMKTNSRSVCKLGRNT